MGNDFSRKRSGPSANLRRVILRDGSGSFRPGPGGLPPYLAGRAEEQALLKSRLALLDRGEPTPSDIILYGPRGNGKTALLVWLKEVAAPSYAVDVLRLYPAKIPTGFKLAERLLPRAWWNTVAPDTNAFRGITWRPGKDAPAPAPDEALAVRVSKRALVLLLDEAHTLGPEVGPELLNALKEVGREAPLLLVLAGTPDLQAHLGTMGASFRDRSLRLPLGRLNESDATEGIRRPLASDDLTISDDALAFIVRESHGYPFFLQLRGAAVWNRVSGGGSVLQEITVEDTEDCRSRRGNGSAIRNSKKRFAAASDPASLTTRWKRRWSVSPISASSGGRERCRTGNRGSPA